MKAILNELAVVMDQVSRQIASGQASGDAPES